jgi:cytochrome c5
LLELERKLKGTLMLQKSTVAALTLVMTACAHQVTKTDASPTPQTVTVDQQAAENAALAAQLESKDVKEYVCYLCTLPEPERCKKAKELLAANRLLASCAFDDDCPVPEDPGPGTIATIPACPVEQGQSAPQAGQGC